MVCHRSFSDPFQYMTEQGRINFTVHFQWGSSYFELMADQLPTLILSIVYGKVPWKTSLHGHLATFLHISLIKSIKQF